MENDEITPAAQPQPEPVNLRLRWVGFVSFSLLLLYSAFNPSEIDSNSFLIVVGLAALCVPHKGYQIWLAAQWKMLTDLFSSLVSLGFWLAVLVLIVWGGWKFLGGIGNGLGSFGRYEGMTAEEWYDEYADAEYRAGVAEERTDEIEAEFEDFKDSCFRADNGYLICLP